MSDGYVDPSGNTEQFRAFANPPDATTAVESPSRLPLVLGGAVVGVLLVAVATWLVLS
ncbi:hypothetical protein [Micromonospora sp. KC721]|uniref:hypothetical protein n=1 Tax=Micromonospora sp. KC721 TaxID=2530380 RepID=UPI00140429EB|nr:hypothetical protein [Micromonospora sp. KC721]